MWYENGWRFPNGLQFTSYHYFNGTLPLDIERIATFESQKIDEWYTLEDRYCVVGDSRSTPDRRLSFRVSRNVEGSYVVQQHEPIDNRTIEILLFSLGPSTFGISLLRAPISRWTFSTATRR